MCPGIKWVMLCNAPPTPLAFSQVGYLALKMTSIHPTKRGLPWMICPAIFQSIACISLSVGFATPCLQPSGDYSLIHSGNNNNFGLELHPINYLSTDLPISVHPSLRGSKAPGQTFSPLVSWQARLKRPSATHHPRKSHPLKMFTDFMDLSFFCKARMITNSHK